MFREQAPVNQANFEQRIGQVLLGGEQAHESREALVSQAFNEVVANAAIFANQMRSNRMPVSLAFDDHKENVTVPRSFGRTATKKITRSTRYPMWIVLEDLTLSGESMHNAIRYVDSHHPSAPSSEAITPAEFGNKPFDNYYHDTKYRHTERAVVVTTDGQLRVVRRSRKQSGWHGDLDSVMRAYKLDPSKLAMPADIFGREGVKSGNLPKLVATMQAKFAEAAKKSLDLKLTGNVYTPYVYEPQSWDDERNDYV
jgi:hypothetical protein